MKRVGLDIGSTTIKCVVIDGDCHILYHTYRRHKSAIKQLALNIISEVSERYPDESMLLSVSGSAGMGLANDLELPFVQEVYATRTAVRQRNPETDTVIELGGEDAKILFLDGNLEVRMNGTCAGGTGAFIDQMISLLGIDSEMMNTLASQHEKIYTIASRCGVFAKSDIQPLINQGARKEDIAASIFYAVVNQTVAGLAQGREITGNVLYLGGPLTFYSELRTAFDDVLKIKGISPDESLYYVALGAALSPSASETKITELISKISAYSAGNRYEGCKPLFPSKEEYDVFRKRHFESGKVFISDHPSGKLYLGIDSGSTTVKAVLCDTEGRLFHPFYQTNNGNPVGLIRQYLSDLCRDYPDLQIAASAVTGYGEDMIKNAFRTDIGVVETVAHYTAAKHFCPDVDFIIDIGGQDIKCFRIRNNAIDSIFLNEACSSGCGSFLQTFAGVLGLSPEEFAEKALYADKPVDLGSRCTVFMNSSVKQAQKDGASVENIAAGLSISVVKNALYKVIRCADAESLGNHIVVQGGTFGSDAVLRAFEQETGKNVIRPSIAGLMGAYGAALYAMEKCSSLKRSALITATELERFTHEVKAITCKGCGNHCRLTVNTFSGGNTYIAGNRCERPLKQFNTKQRYNLYEYKNTLLKKYRKSESPDGRVTIGIPMGLNLYELLPFWHTLLEALGFRVVVSPMSTHELYRMGQHTIPSDTVCYPAKLLHGHIEALLRENVDAIFYPSMTYNLNEKLGANHYNCPVVAYYPEVIGANVKALKNIKYINGFIGLHDKKEFPKHFVKMMSGYGYSFSVEQVKKAAESAYAEYDGYLRKIHEKANEYLTVAKQNHLPVIVLAGRPYHIDPEINHGIDQLICDLGAVVLSEDSVSNKEEKFSTTVLNQWTYHSRLYAAAKFVGECKDVNINLIQLISFGCGVDAVTSDEVRAILESYGKLCTQIKIDEITNLGAVKIRLRSLFAVTEKDEKQ